jgi:hypothetical protein
MQFKTIAALAFIGLTSASPVQKRGVAPNTQSCHVADNVLFLSYSIDIGITYAGGVGCDDVLHALQAQSIAVTEWKCVDDGAGDTQLFFNTPDTCPFVDGCGDSINKALAQEYPTVNGFNCPNS